MADKETINQIDVVLNYYPADKRSCTITGMGRNATGCIFFVATWQEASAMGKARALNAAFDGTGVLFETTGMCRVTGAKVTVDAGCGVNDLQFRQGCRNLFKNNDINAGIG